MSEARKGVWDSMRKKAMTQHRTKITRSRRALIGRKNRSVMEAKMADPSGEGWPSFLSETMSGLDPNFNNDRSLNEPMIADFDGRSLSFFKSTFNACKILYFLPQEQWSQLVVYAPTCIDVYVLQSKCCTQIVRACW